MDATAGFRCYRPELLAALDRLDIRSNGYSFQVEMTYYSERLGFHIREEPILFEERVHATSKMSQSKIAVGMHIMYQLSIHRFLGRADRRGVQSGSESVAVKDR
jgi:dolichol-phosphate mannosyltransferase